MKKLLFLAFACIFLSSKAQIPNELLKGFDEKKAIKELKQKGLDPDEFLFEQKRQYAVKRAHELGYYDYQKNPKKRPAPNVTTPDQGKTRYINLTPQITSSCPNSYFGQLNFTNWTCLYGALAQTNPPTVTWVTGTPTWTTGQLGTINDYLSHGTPGTLITSVPSTNRHVILTTAPTNNDPSTGPVIGYDSLAINPTTNLADIPVIPPGGTSSLRLGNATPGESFTWAETERIYYSLTVTASTTQFTYQYAVVLNNPLVTGAHAPDETPFFDITVTDQSGNQIGGPCGQYHVTSDLASDTSYHFVYQNGSLYNNYLPVYYKNWTTVTIDLTAQMGQTVNIEFKTADCSRTGHFGYAYLDAYCGSLVGSASGICGGVGTSVLNAPPGFSSYQWYNPQGQIITGATASSYTAASVTVGDTFTVHMVSPSGCNSIIKIGINGSIISANYGSTPSCEGGSQGTASANIPGGGNFSYTWTNSLGANVGSTPTISGIPAGTYSIHIVDNTGTCPPKDTTVKVQEIFPALQTRTDTMCGSQIVLAAPTTAPYTWYNNSNQLIAGATSSTYFATGVNSGQHFTVTYKNPTSGCRDSLRMDLAAITLNFGVLPYNPCGGGTNGHIQISATRDSIYDWSVTGTSQNGYTVTMPPTVLQVNNLGGGTYTVNVNVSGNPTCKFSQVVSLVPGQISTTSDTIKGCALDNLSIPTATVSGSTHSWTHGTTWLNNHSYPYITNGVSAGDTYTDTIRDANGCVTVYKAVLKQKSFKLNITAPDKIKCHDDSTGELKVTVTQEVNGPLGTPYVFTWNYPSPYTAPAPMNGTTAIPQSVAVNGLHAGTYTCNVQSGTCVGTATYTLANPAALPDDSLFSYFCPKDSMTWLFAEAGHTQYNWLHNGVPVSGNNNDSIAVTPATISEYIVWYTISGCRDTARILFTFPSYHAIHPDKIVNIFTPNGDERNDKFYPFHDQNISQYEIDKQMEFFTIVIYNRWGKKVYETDEYAKPWDGNVNGTAQDDGTYYYILRYKSNCGSKADIVEKHGFVQLLR